MAERGAGPGAGGAAESGRRDGRAGLLRPGDWVTHPGQPDWGAGLVQSVVGSRVTVTFEHAGKVLVNAALVALQPLP